MIAQPPQPQTTTTGRTAPRRYDCLIEGTLVATDRGAKPVEQIQTGDRVLTHNFETGQTEYQIVRSPTIRPETPTIRIQLEEGIIQSSGGHPFWVED